MLCTILEGNVVIFEVVELELFPYVLLTDFEELISNLKSNKGSILDVKT